MTGESILQNDRTTSVSSLSAGGKFAAFWTVRRGIAVAAVWLVLAGASTEALLVGAVVVPLATWISLTLIPAGHVRLGPVIALLPRFGLRSLLGGIDVAWRAFHPGLPIKPGTVRLAVDLPDGGRVALGGELSLMPGTLAAGSDGNHLLIHVLNLDQDVEASVKEEEGRLRRTLDEAYAVQDKT